MVNREAPNTVRLIAAVKKIVTANRAMTVSCTKKADFDTAKTIIEHYGVRDYLLVVKAGAYAVYPLRSGMHCSLEQVDNVYFIAGIAEVCECDVSLANKLLSNIPTVHRSWPIERLTQSVSKILDLQAWRGWHKVSTFPTDNPAYWPHWLHYFREVGNPVMTSYLKAAIVLLNEKQAEDEKEAKDG